MFYKFSIEAAPTALWNILFQTIIKYKNVTKSKEKKFMLKIITIISLKLLLLILKTLLFIMNILPLTAVALIIHAVIYFILVKKAERLTEYFIVINKPIIIPFYKIPIYLGYKNMINQMPNKKAKEKLKEMKNINSKTYKQRMLISNAKLVIVKLEKGVVYKTHTHENIKQGIEILKKKGFIQIINIRKDKRRKPLLREKFFLYGIHSIKDFKNLFKLYTFYTIKFRKV